MSSERPKKPDRKPTAYGENITFSLSSLEDVPKLAATGKKIDGTTANANQIVEQVDVFSARIKFHALSRVDIFFYILIAYYGTGRVVSVGETIGQHGEVKGTQKDRTFLHAAHSSLFPNLIDRLPTELPGQSTKGILSGTPFFDAMNATVALPQAVNAFDKQLEGNRMSATSEALDLEYPEIARRIINEVSQGLYGPVKGLNKFLNVMEFF